MSAAAELRAAFRVVERPARTRAELPAHDAAFERLAGASQAALAATLGRNQLARLARCAPDDAHRRHFNAAEFVQRGRVRP